ncbi:hypothetical protein ABPG73_008943 [Tetrahymena malaccensis]
MNNSSNQSECTCYSQYLELNVRIEDSSQNDQSCLVHQNIPHQQYQQQSIEDESKTLEEFNQVFTQQDANNNNKFTKDSQKSKYYLQNKFYDNFPILKTWQNSTFQPNYHNPSSISSFLDQENPNCLKKCSPSPKRSHKNQNKDNSYQKVNYCKNKKKYLEQSSKLSTKNQSSIKNNIRDFLTPIVRMKQGFVDFELLKKENLRPLKYQYFLIKNFCVHNGGSLKIRQSTIDSILDSTKNSQLIERKVFVLIFLKSLQHYSKIVDEDASEIGSALSNCTNLQNLTLGLADNQIGEEGLSNLVSSLINCTNLSNLTLDLTFNEIDDKSTLGLGSALANFNKLPNLFLFLGENQIGDEGASGLGFALGKCTNLTNLTVYLGGNFIGKEGALGLGSALANNFNLQNLELDLGYKKFNPVIFSNNK